MSQYRKHIAIRVLLITLLNISICERAQSAGAQYSTMSRLSQRTKEFFKHSLQRNHTVHDTEAGETGITAATTAGNTDEVDSPPKVHGKKKHVDVKEEMAQTKEGRPTEFGSKGSSKYLLMAQKQKHSQKTKLARHKKSKSHHHVKSKKTKPKNKTKRKKSRSEVDSLARNSGDVDTVPKYQHPVVGKLSRYAKHEGHAVQPLSMPLRTNKSTMKGKDKLESRTEERGKSSAKSAHSFESSTAISNETLRDAEEALLRESLRRMHIELIKLKILRLLRMESPPNITRPMPMIPPQFLEDSALRDEPPIPDTADSSLPSQAVVFAEQELLACPQKTAKCVSFDLGRYSGQRADSAELWVYKEFDPQDHYNHTLVVYELEEPGDENRPQLRQVVDALETDRHGWVKFKLRKTVDFWLDKPHRNYGLQIFCKTCKAGRHRLTPIATSSETRPVLIVRFSERHRVPRGLPDYCHSRNKVCCKEKLKIDFEEIGWGDWIIFPKTFEPSFCRGTCETARSMPGINTHHSNLLKTYIHSIANPALEEALHTDLQTCCAPTKMRRVSMLLMDDRQNVIKQDMELVVGECGCVV
ncbi:inhibin beta B chain-like [Liolophura sinensis]|uniref:inhibin beta B chain-like n=1 Tax=Liolophura sinensis TaxID=3198878 RepID=UPI003157F9AE